MSGLIRGAKFAVSPLLLARADAAGGIPSFRNVSGVREQGVQEECAISESSEPLMTYTDFERTLGGRLADMVHETREQGLREGREQGVAEVRKEQSAQLEAMAAFVRDARRSMEQDIVGLTEVAAEVVFEAVVKIVGRAGATADGVTAIVREVVERAKDRSRLRVRVRRTDLEWITEHRARLLEGLDADSVDFVADERVSLGGCILETPTGNLDGRLETQLAGLREVLLSARMQFEGDQ